MGLQFKHTDNINKFLQILKRTELPVVTILTCFLSSPYPTYSRVGRGNLVLKHTTQLVFSTNPQLFKHCVLSGGNQRALPCYQSKEMKILINNNLFVLNRDQMHNCCVYSYSLCHCATTLTTILR